jgi:hypothetical protein
MLAKADLDLELDLDHIRVSCKEFQDANASLDSVSDVDSLAIKQDQNGDSVQVEASHILSEYILPNIPNHKHSHPTKKETIPQSSDSAHVQDTNTNDFGREIDIESFLVAESHKSKGLGLPLKFESLEKEVNVMAWIEWLGCGHGYDSDLRKYLKRDSLDTVRFGIMAMVNMTLLFLYIPSLFLT